MNNRWSRWWIVVCVLLTWGSVGPQMAAGRNYNGRHGESDFADRVTWSEDYSRRRGRSPGWKYHPAQTRTHVTQPPRYNVTKPPRTYVTQPPRYYVTKPPRTYVPYSRRCVPPAIQPNVIQMGERE